MQVLRSYAREQREKRSHKQAVDVAALENFYKDQFGMLSERVAEERKNVEVRDTAQSEVSYHHSIYPVRSPVLFLSCSSFNMSMFESLLWGGPPL